MGATKGNAGVIHAFQLPLGSLKGRLCLEGNRMYDQVARELDVPFRRVGLLLVSLKLLESLVLALAYAYFKLKGVDVEWVGRARLRRMEPFLPPEARMALLFPSAGVVSPLELAAALAETRQRTASSSSSTLRSTRSSSREAWRGSLRRRASSRRGGWSTPQGSTPT